MTTQEKAALICSVAASTHTFKPYSQIAYELGFKIKRIKTHDNNLGEPIFEYEGPDMKAVNIAAQAWLSIDGAALDLGGPNDPRRDAAAEAMIRDGFKGWDEKE